MLRLPHVLESEYIGLYHVCEKMIRFMKKIMLTSSHVHSDRCQVAVVVKPTHPSENYFGHHNVTKFPIQSLVFGVNISALTSG